jgi:CBS domain-containing protein
MKIAQVMTTEVKTCSERDSLSKAARIMWDQDCGCVPVVDAEAKIVGIITDRDIAMAAYTQGLPLHSIRADAAMQRRLVSCSADDDLQTAEELMRQNQIRRVPVLDPDGKVVGIVSLNDLALAVRRPRTEETTPITGHEISETLSAICRPRGHVFNPIGFAPEAGELEFVPTAPAKHGPLRR